MGGMDPSRLDSAFLGHPDFQSRGPKNLQRSKCLGSGLKIGAAQKHILGLVSQTIAATPPFLSVKMAYRSPMKGLTRGGTAEKACL